MAKVKATVNAYTLFGIQLAALSVPALANSRVIELPTKSSIHTIEEHKGLDSFAFYILNTAFNEGDLSALALRYGLSECLPKGPKTSEFQQNLANSGVNCEKKAKEKSGMSYKRDLPPWSNVNPREWKASAQKRLGSRALYSFSNNNSTIKNFMNGQIDLNFSFTNKNDEIIQKPTYTLRHLSTPLPTENQVVVSATDYESLEQSSLQMVYVKEIVEEFPDAVEEAPVFQTQDTVADKVHRGLGLRVKPFDTVKVRLSRVGDSWDLGSAALRLEEGAGLVFIECRFQKYGAGIKVPVKSDTLEIASTDVTKKPIIRYTLNGASSQTQFQYNFESLEFSGGISISI